MDTTTYRMLEAAAGITPSGGAFTGTYAAGTVYPLAVTDARVTQLADGRILVVGGTNTSVDSINSTRIGTISGNTITWVTSTNYPTTISSGSLVTLPDGRVLYTAGISTAVTGASYFGTISGNTITWAMATGVLPTPRYASGYTLLADGRLAIFGGVTATYDVVATVSLGTISGTVITWVAGTNLPQVVQGQYFALLPDGRLASVGGFGVGGATAICNYGTISGNTITWATGTTLPVAANKGWAAVFATELIVIAGYTGAATNRVIRSVPSSGAWSAAPVFPITYSQMGGTKLADGRYYLVGGYAGSNNPSYFVS